MAVTLYYFPGYCPLATHALLIQAQVPYKLNKVDLPNKLTEDGDDYLAINPRGAVPAMKLEDGTIITQQLAIWSYIASQTSVDAVKFKAASDITQIRLFEALGFCGDLHHMFDHLFFGITGDAKEVLDKLLNQQLENLEKWVATNNTLFWLSDEPSYADYQLSVILGWADLQKIDLSHLKRVTALKERILSLPNIQQARKEEGME